MLWQSGQIIDLGTLPTGNNSVANGINLGATIAGTSNKQGTYTKVDRAVVWTVR